jgi:hypothetical protein
MSTKLFTLALAGFAALAAAAPAPWDGGSGGGSTTGTPQCCQDVQNSSDPTTAALVKALLGIDVSGLNVPIGTGCSGLSVVGGVEWYARAGAARPCSDADGAAATRTRSLAARSTPVRNPGGPLKLCADELCYSCPHWHRLCPDHCQRVSRVVG